MPIRDIVSVPEKTSTTIVKGRTNSLEEDDREITPA